MPKFTLEVIGEGTKQESKHASFIKGSHDKGGVFRHLSSGYAKDVHALVIADACGALFSKGKAVEEVAKEISNTAYSAGNTSSWNKMLNNALHWKDEDGNYKRFDQRFGGARKTTTHLEDI